MAATVSVDANGNVLNSTPTNFPTGKLKVNGVAVTTGGGGGAGITDGDKGDITVSGSGATWAIDNNTVSLAKLADMATASFLGRKTAGTGDPEVLSISEVKTMLGIGGAFGTAAYVNTGTSAGDIPVLGTGGKLPAVDGSLLTNLPGGVVDGQQIFDDSHVLAADFGERKFYSPNGTDVAVDFSDGNVSFFNYLGFVQPDGQWGIGYISGTGTNGHITQFKAGSDIWVNADEVYFYTLPTTDPGSVGQLWNSNGAVVLSGYTPSSGGDVVGPASSTDNAIARFDSTTGKLIQNSGITVADGASGTLSGTNTGDQTISDATISTSDITTNNTSTTKHGFAPKLDNDATHFLNGQGGWTTPAGGGGTTVSSIGITIDGAGSAITTGVKGYISVPYACTINSVTMLADVSGSAVVDVWKDTYANYPPTVADTITASAKPTISSAIKSQDTTLTGWTTSVSAGDVLAFKVDSASTITRLHVILKVTK